MPGIFLKNTLNLHMERTNLNTFTHFTPGIGQFLFLLLKIKFRLYFEIVNSQTEYGSNIPLKYVSFPLGFQLGVFIWVHSNLH